MSHAAARPSVELVTFACSDRGSSTLTRAPSVNGGRDAVSVLTMNAVSGVGVDDERPTRLDDLAVLHPDGSLAATPVHRSEPACPLGGLRLVTDWSRKTWHVACCSTPGLREAKCANIPAAAVTCMPAGPRWHRAPLVYAARVRDHDLTPR